MITAAPERDRWDIQAERELPCSMECGGQLHAIGCLARLRPTYAAGLRKTYSEGQRETIDMAMKLLHPVRFENDYPVEAVSKSDLLQIPKLIEIVKGPRP